MYTANAPHWLLHALQLMSSEMFSAVSRIQTVTRHSPGKVQLAGCSTPQHHTAVTLSPVYSDTTQLNSTQLPAVDPPTARRRFWTSWPSWSSLGVMTSCMMQNSHEIREFVWLHDRIDIMESWTEELENKLIEL